MTEGAPAPDGGSELWHFLEVLLGKVGFYRALAAVVVVVCAWQASAILQQLRRWMQWIVLWRQTRSTTAETTAERSEKLTQRIRAVRATEEAPTEADDQKE